MLLPAAPTTYRWACASSESARSIAHELRCAGLGVGVANDTVILPLKLDELKVCLLDLEQGPAKQALVRIILQLSAGPDAPMSRRDRASAATMRSAGTIQGSLAPRGFGKSSMVMMVLKGIKRYLS